MKAVLLCALFIGLTAAAGRFHGLDFAAWCSNCLNVPDAKQAINNYAATKANTFALVVTYYGENADDTGISFRQGSSLTDGDIESAFAQARNLRMKLALKPHVDLVNNAWRGTIGGNFSPSQWRQWFNNYQNYMYHMADLAKKWDVELFVVGTELAITEKESALWRETIAGIKSRYHGLTTYGQNHQDNPSSLTDIDWWDAVDIIGFDAYYVLASQPNPPVEILRDTWTRYIPAFEALSRKWGKPIMFPEIGYQSVDNTAMTPWQASGPISQIAQANCYVAFFETVGQQSWFDGEFFWAWARQANNGGPNDNSFTPHNKTAEKVLRYYWQ